MERMMTLLREELMQRYRLTKDQAVANALWEVAEAIGVTLDRVEQESISRDGDG